MDTNRLHLSDAIQYALAIRDGRSMQKVLSVAATKLRNGEPIEPEIGRIIAERLDHFAQNAANANSFFWPDKRYKTRMFTEQAEILAEIKRKVDDLVLSGEKIYETALTTAIAHVAEKHNIEEETIRSMRNEAIRLAKDFQRNMTFTLSADALESSPSDEES